MDCIHRQDKPYNTELVKAQGDFITKGDQFVWRWHGWPDEVEERGGVLEANGTSQVRFSFRQEGAQAMACAIKIYAAEGENFCEIIQENIPDD